MDQKKIGYFIQNLRKEQNYTQKELADQIGISDKTVSKWETGNGLPDISVLLPLCEALHINVNELLSGERLSESAYSKKAEENMIHLLKENETNKKTGHVQCVLGIILLILGMLFFELSLYGVTGGAALLHYIDYPTFLFLSIPCLALVLIMRPKGGKNTIAFLKKILPPVCAIESLFDLIVVLYGINEMSELGLSVVLGPSLSVVCLIPLYAAIAYLLLVLLEKRYEQ